MDAVTYFKTKKRILEDFLEKYPLAPADASL